ncbi:helicase-related protein [Streptomyces rhizosphaericus]|uniref:helicase-related protein n=1 Tax=Streptomyces rhizosphaericus TaxID=114699 RepID=UPI0035D3EDD7
MARHFLSAGIGELSTELQPTADWIADQYHPEWLLCQALPRRIGIHHGKIPRALAQYQVSAFNEGKLDFLICTSTLIEGVNTSAKNVVIFDHTLNRKNLDFFTFSNIKGRSGRMMRHFVGNVYLFKRPPEEELPTVDVPLYSQTEAAPDSLLIQVDESDLQPTASERMEKFRQQNYVDLDVLRQNAGIDPQSQIDLAKEVRRTVHLIGEKLAWNRWPKYENLLACCQLITQFLHPVRGRIHGVSSSSQLAYRMTVLNGAGGDIKELIDQELASNYETPTPDDAVENVLDFIRYWPEFTFPRLIMTVQSIINPILVDAGFQECDYSAYAASAKSLFMPRFVTDMEEYGLPVQLAMKLLKNRQANFESIDDLLRSLSRIQTVGLDSFESSLYSGFIQFL